MESTCVCPEVQPSCFKSSIKTVCSGLEVKMRLPEGIGAAWNDERSNNSFCRQRYRFPLPSALLTQSALGRTSGCSGSVNGVSGLS